MRSQVTRKAKAKAPAKPEDRSVDIQATEDDAGAQKEGIESSEFVFVNVTGQRNRQDRGTRKLIRTHVMRNYLDHADDEEKRTSQPSKAISGQKYEFKLRPDGLEAFYPYHPKPKPAPARKVKLGPQMIPDRGYLHSFSVKPGVDVSSGKTGTSDPIRTSTDWEDGDEAAQSLLFPADREGVKAQQLQDLFPGWDGNADFPMSLPNSPIIPFGKSRLDPFDTLPFSLTRADEVLVDRYTTVIPAYYCPISIQSGWFSFAKCDALLFHASLHIRAMHIIDADPRTIKESPEILEHKLAAIRLANERLDDPVESLRDETIGAVVCMANVEASFGSTEAATTHMVGLQRMVDMRGGLGALGDGINGLLQRFCFWTDICHAEVVNEPPRFQPLVTPADVFSVLPIPTLSAFHLQKPVFWESLSEQIVFIFHEIRRLGDILEGTPPAMLRNEDKRELSDSLAGVEKRSFILSRKEDWSDDAYGVDSLKSRACSQAALMYCHSMLRRLPIKYHLFDSLTRNLQRILAQIDMTSWAFAPEILIWLLVTGAVVSEGRPQRPWFIQQLANVCESFGKTYWEDVQAILQSFLWIEVGDDKRYLSMWDEVDEFLLRAPELQQRK